MNNSIQLDHETAANILAGQQFIDKTITPETYKQAREMGAAALLREIPQGSPAMGDPEDSICCGNCNNDIADAVLEEYKYCHFCGQKL